jgi:hypothetical protein
MGNIPDAVVVFLIILGCGFCVIMGYAVHTFYFGKGEANTAWQHVGEEQLKYMQWVRSNNLQEMQTALPRERR